MVLLSVLKPDQLLCVREHMLETVAELHPIIILIVELDLKQIVNHMAHQTVSYHEADNGSWYVVRLKAFSREKQNRVNKF